MGNKLAKVLPPAETLRTLFNYDPITGAFTFTHRGPEFFKSLRAYRIYTKRFAGKPAGCVSHGNIVLRWKNPSGKIVCMPAARVAIALHTGKDIPPHMEADHIDRNGINNRITNLRQVTYAQNLYNRGINRNNSSGFKGVCLDKKRGAWEAYIWKDYKKINLGRHPTAELAHQAFREAEKRLRGEYATT